MWNIGEGFCRDIQLVKRALAKQVLPRQSGKMPFIQVQK